MAISAFGTQFGYPGQLSSWSVPQQGIGPSRAFKDWVSIRMHSSSTCRINHS